MMIDRDINLTSEDKKRILKKDTINQMKNIICH